MVTNKKADHGLRHVRRKIERGHGKSVLVRRNSVVNAVDVNHVEKDMGKVEDRLVSRLNLAEKRIKDALRKFNAKNNKSFFGVI